MDMNAFRNYLTDRAAEEGQQNKPTHQIFGDVLASVNTSKRKYTNPDIKTETVNQKVNLAEDRGQRVDVAEDTELITGKDILDSFAIVDLFNENIAEDLVDGEDLVDVIQECVELLDIEDEDERLVSEAYDVVDYFYNEVMKSGNLTEGSEDLETLVEEALDLIVLDEVYGTKLPTMSQGLSDEEKRKVQKGETSKMPKAGVEDKLPGEQQSKIDAIKAVLGGKKSSAADSAY